MKKLSLYLMAAFYAYAGANHFINPEFYGPLIPDYLPFPEFINSLSGILEIVAAMGLLFWKTRRWSVFLILAMLIAFIPSHIYFIQIGSCVPDGLCIPFWGAWIRLLVVHPILMLWAYWHRTV